ncbi:hypothetical protein LSUB1_G006443 [Lachnellula subtilissima]|uniref:DUF4267 domain-containing protein n=1 Tax=Lachnellula subtilissima TaxID=602034 RepID=A0A8H8UA25_9HELO|nr:hypothetical protein LSUB1_G006443 [Lachnellula subtilissima]
MFEQFSLRHIPALFVAVCVVPGGMMALWDPEGAIRLFGLPERIAISQPAHPIQALGSARISALGMAIWGLYLTRQYRAVDVVLASMSWIAVVDGLVCYQEGAYRTAVWRAISTGVLGVWGLCGMTAGRN